MNLTGEYSTNQNALIKFESLNPTNGQYYASEYITGFSLVSGGQYQYIPNVIFNNYYYITGILQNFNSMLFSSGCSGNIPIIFSNAGGHGASGNLLLQNVNLNNLYVVGNASYYIVTGLDMSVYGTSYTGISNGTILSGIYNNCYDVPAFYGSNLYSFTQTNIFGSNFPEASYLTGTVLIDTGLFSGITGYTITGLDITNIGHGYNYQKIPTCNFIRQSGDFLISGATGNFLLKNSGIYNFNTVWSVNTGWTNGNMAPLTSGFSGILNGVQRFFSITLQCSGLDNTSGVVGKLSVIPAYGTGLIQNITGTKYYNNSAYFLKKKLNNFELLIPPNGELSFLIGQSDLDSFYTNYLISSEGIDIGSLDF